MASGILDIGVFLSSCIALSQSSMSGLDLGIMAVVLICCLGSLCTLTPFIFVSQRMLDPHYIQVLPVTMETNTANTTTATAANYPGLPSRPLPSVPPRRRSTTREHANGYVHVPGRASNTSPSYQTTGTYALPQAKAVVLGPSNVPLSTDVVFLSPNDIL